MVFLIKTLQLLLSLSILVILHEFGHFAFARLFKTRVEKFYLFFNPWFSLFKIKKGETEYGIGWLPLGGYVKISGMIDESMDKEQMKQPPQPYEFRSKKSWQRLLIMLGGVIMNFVLAGFIYICVLFVWGKDYLPIENMKHGISADIVAEKIGFKDGDKIISINNIKYDSFQKASKEIILKSEDERNVQVDRNGKILDILIDDSQIGMILANKSLFINPRFEFVIDSIPEVSYARDSGLKKGDKLIGVNDTSMIFYNEFVKFFRAHKDSKVKILTERNNNKITIETYIDTLGKIGVYPSVWEDLETVHIDYTFLESIPAGITFGVEQVKDYLRQFKLIFNSKTKGYKSLGSFGAIGSMFPSKFNWHDFWMLTAFLSIILGVINILPIPALDGGHVMFVLYEMISGRKPGDKFLEYAQIVGFVILIAIMVYAIRNDIVNFLL
ncbi:MAG: RIP metalloprotease RseP [Bacteroidales bacterium]|nr:RIP metalloprotease RseP [Bacteroidales bacterium]